MTEMINYLSARVKEAYIEKQYCYDKYCMETSGPAKLKWKSSWQIACKRLRNLKIAIEVIESEYGNKPKTEAK